MRGFVALIAVAGMSVSLASAEVHLIGSFNPAAGGAMNSIGFNRGTDELVVHFNYSTQVHVLDRTGSLLRAYTKPSGVTGNDDDLEFADEPVNVNGTWVPANSLFVIENDDNPPRIVAGRASDGVVLAQQAFSTDDAWTWTGGAYHHGRNTFFCTSWTGHVVQEVNAGTGVVLRNVDINPEGAPEFFFYYSDVDVLRADGNLYLVSSNHTYIRVLTPMGTWLGDIDVSAFGITQMAGIAFDDVRGEAWICTQGGMVYHLGGFEALVVDPCSDADLTYPYGTLDFFDVQTYLGLFSAFDPAADLVPDGVINFFDVQRFLQLFSAGCP